MCGCGMGLDLSQVHNSDRDLGIVLSGQRNMILVYGKKKMARSPPLPLLLISPSFETAQTLEMIYKVRI